MTELGRAAVEYAKKEFFVFQLAPNTKIPFAETNGHFDATKDIARVSKWWKDRPHANIGIALGPSNLCVLDFDPKPGLSVDDILFSLETNFGSLPKTVQSYTPRKGNHLWFRSYGLQRRVIKPIEGLDILSDGYIVAPPSTTRTGDYFFDEDFDLTALAPLPTWVETINPPSSAVRDQKKSNQGFLKILDGVKEGSRHDTLVKIAGHLLGRVNPNLAWLSLLAINEKYFKPPLDLKEVNDVVDWVAGRRIESLDDD